MEELPKPLSKQDKFLHNIADGTPNIDNIEAISRQDKYLKYIALNGGASGNASQEVGQWTPTLVNYTDSAHPNTVVDPTYSVVYSNAYYLKMGKLVHINFRIKVEITDIGTGFGCVAGLPFNPDPNMLGQAFTIAENSAVTESEGVVYDGVVGQLYPDIYLETYNERHIPAISLRTDNGIQAKTFKVGTNWISYSGCYVCDDPYVPPQDSLVTIEHGGTSGKTADEARTNLNIYSKAETDSFLNSKANTADLSTVATSGSYIDLSNKPTIPTKTSDLTNDSEFITKAVSDLTNYYTKSDTDSLIPKSTTNNMTIYISPTGNDETGAGTSNNPYLTITYALSIIPKIINHGVTLNISEGSYNETISITGFSGSGTLNIFGTNATVSSLAINSNTLCRINIKGILCTSVYNTLIFGNTSLIDISNCTFGSILSLSHGLILLNKVTIENSNPCVIATGGGIVNIKDLTVETVGYAVSAENGSMIVLQNLPTSSSGTLYYQKKSGGSIIYPNGTFDSE